MENEENKIPITHPTSDLENEIYQKLLKAQAEARSTPRRLLHAEVFGPLHQKIADYTESQKTSGINHHHAH